MPRAVVKEIPLEENVLREDDRVVVPLALRGPVQGEEVPQALRVLTAVEAEALHEDRGLPIELALHRAHMHVLLTDHLVAFEEAQETPDHRAVPDRRSLSRRTSSRNQDTAKLVLQAFPEADVDCFEVDQAERGQPADKKELVDFQEVGGADLREAVTAEA